MASEKFRLNTPYIYVLTSKAHIIVFKYKFDQNFSECAMKAKIQIPPEFSNQELGFTALRGCLLL